MRTNTSKRKNQGSKSHKVQRIARAKARQEIWDALSPEEKQSKMAERKALYDLYHKS